MTSTSSHQTKAHLSGCLQLLLIAAIATTTAASLASAYPQTNSRTTSTTSNQNTRLAARRAADDSRPISRVQTQPADSSDVIVGKFRAPAPERIHRQRMPSGADFATQTMSASYRIADNSADLPEKIVHGVAGSSVEPTFKARSTQRQVSAKIQVSDEGLNYPPSKLSADIYGNVAEIVTAPPEAVESDFLVPETSGIYGNRSSP